MTSPSFSDRLTRLAPLVEVLLTHILRSDRARAESLRRLEESGQAVEAPSPGNRRDVIDALSARAEFLLPPG